jgi:hypothetical protein
MWAGVFKSILDTHIMLVPERSRLAMLDAVSISGRSTRAGAPFSCFLPE